ncbi:MAG: 16S rRNA (guanine(966)-N(2))-methyltransferase RsmD [Armatimonadia bacterium]|nr:16S rRNA (guanine(966)-N(2))-methyltransferase RsmD [Armatimonadia bacterium]
MALRVVGGHHRGRRLVAPPGADTRPTSDRAREAIFNILGPLEGLRVLDLCAGSGAMGIEALSRGAAWADLVDRSGRACAVIRRNLEELALARSAQVHRAEASAWLRDRPAVEPYHVVIADPPYASDALEEIVAALAGRDDLVAEDGRLVLEAGGEDMPEPPLNLYVCARRRKYGRAHVGIFERIASDR